MSTPVDYFIPMSKARGFHGGEFGKRMINEIELHNVTKGGRYARFCCFSGFAFIPGTVWGADVQNYRENKNSIALKPGYHVYPDSDFFDVCGIDEDDFSDFMFEIAYERKINRS